MYLITHEIKVQILSDYEKSAAIARRSLYHHLKKSDFKPGDKRLASQAFAYEVAENSLIDHFAYVKIWRKDGTVIYSNVREIIGQKIRVNSRLRKVLAGQIIIEQGNYSSEDHQGVALAEMKDREFLEIYAPIKFDGEIVGIFETYRPLDSILEQTRNASVNVVVLVTGSLAVLWLILSGIVRKASSTIRDQEIDLSQLTRSQAKSLQDLEDNYIGTLESLAAAVEARSPYTSGHSRRTSHIARMLADKMGLSKEERVRIGPAAILHDIGKIGTPEAILEKDGPFTDDEWRHIKEHPVVGASIVMATPMLKELVPIIRGHHERYDGTGYPDGLIGQSIPIEARVLGVIDAFDAMVSERPYREALPFEEALTRWKNKGSQFDPAVVDEFLALCTARQRHKEVILRHYRSQRDPLVTA